MKLNFYSLAPLALLSSAALAPLSLASSPQETDTGTPLAGDPLNLTPVPLQSPGDLKGNSITVVTGLSDLQEEELPCMFGVQLDTTLYMKSMIGITDSIYEISSGVMDAANLKRHDNLDERDAIVSVGPTHGLAIHYIQAGQGGAVYTMVLDSSLTSATQVTTGDVNNNGRDDIIVGDGKDVKIFSGTYPFNAIPGYTGPSPILDLMTLNWNHAVKDQVLVKYANGFEILNFAGGSMNVYDARFGDTFPSYYGRLEGTGTNGRDELAWVMDSPTLGQIVINLWHLPGPPIGSSGFGTLDSSWDITSVSAGDLNGDGLDDLTLSLASSDDAIVLTNMSASSSVPFDHVAGGSHSLVTGQTGILEQSPIAIGDFDDDGVSDMAIAISNSTADYVVVFDQVEDAVADASGQTQTANSMSGLWEYHYTAQDPGFSYLNEDDFMLEAHWFPAAPVNTNDLRFTADLTLSEVSAKLQVALFQQKTESTRVTAKAFAHQRQLEHQGGSVLGLDLDYRVSFPRGGDGTLGGNYWQGSQRRLFLFARPERIQGVNVDRPPILVGYKMNDPWGGVGEQYAIRDTSIGSPYNSAYHSSNNTNEIPVANYVGASCPAPTSMMVLAPVGGVIPIKRIVPPVGSNPSLGTPNCVSSEF